MTVELPDIYRLAEKLTTRKKCVQGRAHSLPRLVRTNSRHNQIQSKYQVHLTCIQEHLQQHRSKMSRGIKRYNNARQILGHRTRNKPIRMYTVVTPTFPKLVYALKLNLESAIVTMYADVNGILSY